MIIKPTVFVLGAGASMPYGFPSGWNLVKDTVSIGKNLTGKWLEHLYFLNKNFQSDQVKEFVDALFLSSRSSIDAFLEYRHEYIEIGKASIALLLCNYETHENLFDFRKRTKGCYHYLFNKLISDWKRFSENKVSFITFNYDRSLEHFLFTSLRNTFGKSKNECAEQVHRIPIIHVHGSLGNLSWQAADGIPYGAVDEDTNERTDKNILSAAKQIKIITEDRVKSDEFQKAHQLLSESERIYFLGFGYDPINMERLGIQTLSSKARIMQLDMDGKPTRIASPLQGTGLGLEIAETRSIQEKWGVSIPDNSSDSLTFLRKYADLD